jgi:Tfp pilus assembly protein PilF
MNRHLFPKLAASILLITIILACSKPATKSDMNQHAKYQHVVFKDRNVQMHALQWDAANELRTHDYVSAERDYKQLIALDPSNPFRYRGLAMTYDAEGKSKEAYQAWTKTLNGSPSGRSSDQTDPYILANYGELCLKNGDEEGAAKAFAVASRSVKILTDPKFERSADSEASKQGPRTLAHYNAGLEMSFGGQKDKSREELQKVVELAPGWGVAKVALAYELWREGRRDEAEDLLEPLEVGSGPMAKFAMNQARTLGLDRNLTMEIKGLSNGKTVDTIMTIDEWNRKHPDRPLTKHLSRSGG